MTGPRLRSSLLALLLLAPMPLCPQTTTSAQWQPLGATIPDVHVVDQDGRTRSFYTDLVKDQTVAIQFIFTRCTMVCTPLGGTFSKLQKLPHGNHTRLISISVDPKNDTPQDLRQFSERFGPRTGWTLITGNPVEIARLLDILQGKSGHSAMILIGNDHANRWTRAYGLSQVDSLASLMRHAESGVE
jgi:protein SCO1/2